MAKYYDLNIPGSEVQRRLDLASHNVLAFDGILDVPVTASDELITSAESYQILYAPNGGRGEMLMSIGGTYYRNFRLQSSGKTYLDSSWYNEDGQIRKDRLFLNGAARDIYAYAAGSFGKVERDGTDGEDGSDGITPHIDPTTKHWMIGDEDTGIVAKGQDGQDGVDGKSAFDIWLENGHSGNISDFLAWMKDTSSMIGPKFAATTADCVMVNDTPTLYFVPNGTTFNVYLADSDGQCVSAHSLATGVPGDITNYAGIYDISQDKAVNSVPATYGNLSDALGAITEDSKKKGGMTIKFIQGTGADAKYVQYRYLLPYATDSNAFSNEVNWIDCNIDFTKRLDDLDTVEELDTSSLTVYSYIINLSTKKWINSNDTHYWIPCNDGDTFKLTGHSDTGNNVYCFLSAHNNANNVNASVCSIYDGKDLPTLKPNQVVTIVAPSDAIGLCIRKTGNSTDVTPAKIEKVLVTAEDALHELVLMQKDESEYETIFGDLSLLTTGNITQAVPNDALTPTFSNGVLTVAFTSGKSQGFYYPINTLEAGKSYNISVTLRKKPNSASGANDNYNYLCVGFTFGYKNPNDSTNSPYFLACKNNTTEYVTFSENIVINDSQLPENYGLYIGVSQYNNGGQSYEISAIELRDIIQTESVFKTVAAQKIKALEKEISPTVNDVQEYINNKANGDVFIPAGMYLISTPLSIPENTRLHGVRGKTIFKLSGSAERIINLDGNDGSIEIDNITFVGKHKTDTKISETLEFNVLADEPTSEYSDIGIYMDGSNLSSTKRFDVSIRDCDFKEFGLAGIKAEYMVKPLADSNYWKTPKISGCNFHNNHIGISLAERAEFMQVTSCYFARNQFGAYISGANVGVDNCVFTQNFYGGIIVSGDYANSAHGYIGSSSICHNGNNNGYSANPTTFDILFTGIKVSYELSNCLISKDGIIVYDSVGVAISSCQILCPVYYLNTKSSGHNSLTDCVFVYNSAYGDNPIYGDITHVYLSGNVWSNKTNNWNINNAESTGEGSEDSLVKVVSDDELNWTPGQAIVTANGSTNTVGILSASDYIDVSEFNVMLTTVMDGSTAYGIAFYNESRSYISNSGVWYNYYISRYTERMINIPTNAKYARFTSYTDTDTYGQFKLTLMKNNGIVNPCSFLDTFDAYNARHDVGLIKDVVFNAASNIDRFGGNSRRTPGIIISKQGTLIAATDVRSGVGDNSHIGIAVARKVNGSWSYNYVLPYVERDNHKKMNISLAVDRLGTGRIYLFYLDFVETTENKGYAMLCTREDMDCKYIYSDDDGETWSLPISTKTAWDSNEWIWVGAAPNNGIQVAADKIIIPCMGRYKYTESAYEAWFAGLAIFNPTDDTITYSKRTPIEGDNECCVYQIGNDIYLDVRNDIQITTSTTLGNANSNKKQRLMYLYKYNPATNDFTLIEDAYHPVVNICKQCVVKGTVEGTTDGVYYIRACEDSQTQDEDDNTRSRIILLISKDGFKWDKFMLIEPGVSLGYATVDIYEDKIAMTYESDINGEQITFIDLSANGFKEMIVNYLKYSK